MNGFTISETEKIPLGNDFLIETALKHRIALIVTNDAHVICKATKYGLLTENPIPDDVKKSLSNCQID